MSFDTKLRTILDALDTYLTAQYSSYSVHVGLQTTEAPKYVDIAIIAGRGYTDGTTGIWKVPLQVVIKSFGSSTPSSMSQTASEILEKVQTFFSSNNTEPLTDSTYWGRVLGITPAGNQDAQGFYNEYHLSALAYFYEPEFGTLGTVRIVYSTYDITFSVAVDVKYMISRPEMRYAPTSEAEPSAVDRRSHYVDFDISAILIGATARTDCKELVDLMEVQFGDLASNFIVMTFTGALATMFGSTRNVGPTQGSAVYIRAVDGDQYIVRISNLILREVRT